VKMALGGKTALGQEAKAYHVTKASQQLVCLLGLFDPANRQGWIKAGQMTAPGCLKAVKLAKQH